MSCMQDLRASLAAMTEYERASRSVDRVIVDAILVRRMRRGEQALVRLETRGPVQVSSHSGWFVVAPSIEEAASAFRTRPAVEAGILHTLPSVTLQAIGTLHTRIASQREAIAPHDVSAHSLLLDDFDDCMIKAFDNPVLVGIPRNLTAHTLLFAANDQSTHQAICSRDEHERIIGLLESSDLTRTASEMLAHIDIIEAILTKRIERDPLTDPPSVTHSSRERLT